MLNRQLLSVILAVFCAGCERPSSEPAATGGPVVPLSSAPVAAAIPAAPPAVSSSVPVAAAPVIDTQPYPWHADASLGALAAVDHLDQRFEAPAGFERITLEPGSFGAWLRKLPLAAADTPVRAYDGRVLHRVGHPGIVAVTTLDIGKADLQQCADAVMRLHAEWKWSRGEKDMSYRAAAGTPMPYARWERGERVVQNGNAISWQQRGRASVNDHASFRTYLDAVFAWSNTVALSRQAKPVTREELRPGDFMILPGNPGHTVLVLDMAKDRAGHVVVLLGQSYMPAQSFQVLRPDPSHAWFDIDPAAEGVQTPFWPVPFPWSSLRRLD